jgi:hypothetical protein
MGSGTLPVAVYAVLHAIIMTKYLFLTGNIIKDQRGG